MYVSVIGFSREREPVEDGDKGLYLLFSLFIKIHEIDCEELVHITMEAAEILDFSVCKLVTQESW